MGVFRCKQINGRVQVSVLRALLACRTTTDAGLPEIDKRFAKLLQHPSGEAVIMAINSSALKKYGTLISQSTPIRVGSPAVFQLRPVETVVGSLRTMTIGVRQPTALNKAILVVGETGTGKSTMINALVNYAMGVKWEDDIWFHIVKDEKKHQSQYQQSEEEDEDQNQCESQTSDVIVYQIFGFVNNPLPFSLRIIDSPGYGDTRGIEHDDIVSNKLYEYFNSGEGITEIDVVGLVLKATENRVSDRLRYVFDSALSLFGKDMEKNIVAIMTHAPGRTARNALKALEAAKIKCARNERNEVVHFLFDNCQDENREEYPEDLKGSFDKAMRGMKQFTDFLGNAIPQKMNLTVDVLSERIRLNACIANLKERVEFIELKQAEVEQEKVLLQKFEEKMRKNENFVETKKVPYKDYVSCDDKVVSCKVCKENCHDPCSAVGVKCCKSMQNGKCTVCTRECPTSDHVREKNKYVSKTRSVTVTKDDMKRKYNESKVGCENKAQRLQSLEDLLDKLQNDKDMWLDKAFQHVIKLQEIALNADSFSTQAHLDFLILKMEERGDEEKVKTLQELKGRVDKGAMSGLQYRLKQINPLKGLMKK
ncbi:uncharacterized protein [Antennarius striatus]|uniref:uncharacterized protein n=1 Tax=Antennarius striatus TaxID=241820 RepID=UPI0035B474C8